MKPSKYALLFIFVLLTAGHSASAQTPQWNWAKGVGGNGQDGVLGNNSSTFYGSMHTDTSGNVYELITSPSSSITFGTYTFTNPGGGTGYGPGYLVKYNSLGTVVWAKKTGGFVPSSMFTTPQGYSYLEIDITTDSVNIGGVIAKDTSISFYHPGYCIAEYDPNGNVVRINIHKTLINGGGWVRICQFGNEILATGVAVSADTLNGIAIGRGYFLSLMDSLGNLMLVKSIGYDSASFAFLNASEIAVGNKSVYLFLNYFHQPFVYQSNLPIGNLAAYIGSGKGILAKFDSLLHFQWFKTCSSEIMVYAPLYADQDDNVYLDDGGSSGGTLTFDTVQIALPTASSSYACEGVIKVNSNGVLDWAYSALDAGQGGIYGMTTDRVGDVFATGIYSSYMINGVDTLHGYGNIYVTKLSKRGAFVWARNTQKAGPNRVQLGGIGEDGHGNIFINGLFSDPNYHLSFGADSLVCHTPVSGYPLASDVFTARLGNCSPAAPSLVASGSLRWCGRDSVILTASVAHSYLWSTGDTSRSVSVHQSGIYAVYTADTLGCYAQSAADTVYARPLPVLQAIATQQVHCYGGSDGHISVHASGGTGSITYAYNPPISDTLHLTAGIYTITATDSAGCSTHDSLTVTQPATAISLTAAVDHEVLCYGGSDGHVSIHASGGTGDIIYTYQPAITDTLHVAAGLYTITATDSAGCSTHDSLAVTQPGSALTLQTDSLPTSLSGTGVAIVTASGGTPGYDYLWSNTMTTDTISHLHTGWYYVTVTDHNGCEKSDSVYIRLLPTGIYDISEAEIRLYPNPSIGSFYINTPVSGDLVISDLNGKIIMQQTIDKGTSRIESKQWSDGIYLIEFTTGSNRYYSKVTVNR